MINQYLMGRRLGKYVLKDIAAAVGRVHIDHHNEFCGFQCFTGFLAGAFSHHNLVAEGHPRKEAGERIRQNGGHIVTSIFKIVEKS